MNDTQEPYDTLAKSSSHAFPNLRETGLDSEVDNAISSAPFQPMFNKATSSATGTSKSKKNTQEESLEQARQAGYQRGVAAGHEKACQMVQNDLSPIVSELRDTLKRFDEYQQELCETYTNISLKLALDIVEKIIGIPSLLTLEELAEMGTLTHNTMESTYGLSLQFNPQDLKFLKELSACENTLVWENYQGLDVHPDQELKSGEVTYTESDLNWDTIHSQVASSLDKIITTMSNHPR